MQDNTKEAAEHNIIKVVIADDHEIFRDDLRLMLKKAENIMLVGEAADGVALLAIVDKVRPDVVITDIKMPNMDGIEATREITRRFAGIGVLALSMFEEEQLIMDMIDAGGSGYLLKNSDKAELIDAVHAVNANEEYYCKHTSVKLARMIANNKKSKQNIKIVPELDARELQVIQLICEGYTTKEIGEKLFTGIRTMEGVRLKILDKLKAKNSVGVVITAIKLGLYNPE
ncbi:MAG: response regulator transcription factor [Taibaiella sp.]|nr:response regulator transcription factor [Taibaiella sp.]